MICLFGGTFDPVHYGHLRPALEVQQALGIRAIRLLPCHIPPHRPAPLATPEQRLALLRLAVADEPALTIDERELRRGGTSYMVDTLDSLRGESSDEPVCLALGMDAFLGLEHWHRWRSILELCHLVVMERPGNRWPRQGELAQLIARARVESPQRLRTQPAGLVFSTAVTQLAISSTGIRAMLAQGRSPRYLLPDRVLQHIYTQGWYQTRQHATD